MEQNTKPTGSTPKKSKKGKKKKIVAIVLGCLGISLVLIVLAVLGTFGAAYFTNREIPLATNVVEKLEKKTLQNELEKRRDEMVTELVEEIKTDLKKATTEEGLKMSEFLEADEEVKYTDMTLPANIKYDLDLAAENDQTSMSLEMNGENKANNDNHNLEGKMSMKFKASIFSIEEDIDYVYDHSGETMYMKLGGQFMEDMGAFLFPFGGQDDISNKWFFVDLTELEDSEGETFEVEEDDAPLKLTDAEYKEIVELLEKENFKPEVQVLDGKTINGKRTQCFSMGWTDESLDDFIQEATELDAVKDNEDLEDTVKSLEGLKELTVKMCMDRKHPALNGNNEIYEMEISGRNIAEMETTLFDDIGANTNTDTSTEIEYNIKVEITGYGESHNIDIPETDLNIVEYMEEQTSTDYPYTY